MNHFFFALGCNSFINFCSLKYSNNNNDDLSHLAWLSIKATSEHKNIIISPRSRRIRKVVVLFCINVEHVQSTLSCSLPKEEIWRVRFKKKNYPMIICRPYFPLNRSFFLRYSLSTDTPVTLIRHMKDVERDSNILIFEYVNYLSTLNPKKTDETLIEYP